MMTKADMTPKLIWLLLRLGDQGEHVWCDNPHPNAGDAPESVAYIRADVFDRQQARIAELEARLEITHTWKTVDGQEVRVDIPADMRDSHPDGIDGRDETIKLQDERIAELKAEKPMIAPAADDADALAEWIFQDYVKKPPAEAAPFEVMRARLRMFRLPVAPQLDAALIHKLWRATRPSEAAQEIRSRIAFKIDEIIPVDDAVIDLMDICAQEGINKGNRNAGGAAS